MDKLVFEWPPPSLSIQLNSYDRIIIAFSGGKDSLACLLYLLWLGIETTRIELWHHDVDGHEGGTLQMDWPCTPAYVDAVAAAFQLPIYHSWKVGGFEREMLRDEQPTAPIRFEEPLPDGSIIVTQVGGNSNKVSTRLKFPQVSANLLTRWCSSYLKIQVADAALRHQPRFRHRRTLVITGERAEESTNRANYIAFAPHRADLRSGRIPRHIDHWRPVLNWSEGQIWGIIAHYRVNPHPAYRLGWGRVSCMHCIFGSDNQWASAAQIAPDQIQIIDDYESRLGYTIHRKLTVKERIQKGRLYPMDANDIRAALSPRWDEPIFLDNWSLPHGAFGEACGPT